MANHAYPFMRGVDDVLTTLANEKRRRILIVLAAKGPTSVCELIAILKDGQSAMSQNCGKLRVEGFIDYQRAKREHRFHLTREISVTWDGEEVWFRTLGSPRPRPRTRAYGIEIHYEPDEQERQLLGELIPDLPRRVLGLVG